MKLETRSNRESMSFSPQIAFKMQKDGEPAWDQVTIDRLWVTTQREAMVESSPPASAVNPQPSGASEQKVRKEQTRK